MGVRWNHASRDGLRLLCMISPRFAGIWWFVHEGLARALYGEVPQLSAEWTHHSSPDRAIPLRLACHLSQGIFQVCSPARRSVCSRSTGDGSVTGECGNVGISAPYRDQRVVLLYVCTTAVPSVIISRTATWLALRARWVAEAA